MEQGYWRYWGKASPADKASEAAYHLLVYHCLDVAAVGEALIDAQPAWLESLSRLSGLKPEILRPWLIFLLAIHDLGKFALSFQAQRQDLQSLLQGRESKLMGGSERHDTLGYLLAERYFLSWLGQEDDDDMLDMLRPWLAAVAGHHGRPPKNLDASQTKLILRNQFPVTTTIDAHAFIDELIRWLLPEGSPLPTPEPGMAEKYQETSWILAGLAVAADWLGSNRLWFSYHDKTIPLEHYWHEIAKPQARKAVQESGLSKVETSVFTRIQNLFPAIQQPTALQIWAENVILDEGPQIFVLEELTGGGKTEAALTLAARLLSGGQSQGIYLALPTMATADAQFERAKKDDGWRRFFANGEAQLALAHSADKLKLKLEKLNNTDHGYGKGEESSASQNCTAWLADNRKKALLADFAVGTIDQALLMVLPVRHQSLRLLGLASKVLIVDEVHACDCYMGELLSRLLRFHAALGGSAILLSATLPRNQRKRYLAAFAQGAGFASHCPKSANYPLTTHLSAAGLGEQPHIPRESSARTVLVEHLSDEESVFSYLTAAVEQGRCAVWVRNTVVDALESWQRWNTENPQIPADLFHARFALCDRLNIGKAILETFGPDSTPEQRKGRLVIATQVIEQSLDVDFDDMVTDLAPIDLVVQRAGRMQRHKRNAEGLRIHSSEMADGRGGATLAVLMPDPVADAEAGWIKSLLPKTGRVYADHGKLWLTADWLKANKGFKLPNQARDMIEAIYDEAAFERIPQGLKDIADKADGACRAERGVARGNVLSFDEGYSPDCQQWQDEGETPTRLGEATVRIRLCRLIEGKLTPWAQIDPEIDWSLSELSLPRRLIAYESERHAEAIAAAKETMPDLGLCCIIVALEQQDGQSWRGYAKSEKQEVQVVYSAVMGLMITGVEDESDL